MNAKLDVVSMEIVMKMCDTLCDDCKAKVRKMASENTWMPAKQADERLKVIMEAVAIETHVSVDQIRDKNNQPKIVDARRRVAVIARREGISYPKIAGAIRKHHTTVMHLVNTAHLAGL